MPRTRDPNKVALARTMREAGAETRQIAAAVGLSYAAVYAMIGPRCPKGACQRCGRGCRHESSVCSPCRLRKGGMSTERRESYAAHAPEERIVELAALAEDCKPLFPPGRRNDRCD